MSRVCDNIISKRQIDFAFLVVNAKESCLLFNESAAESGYTKVYRALMDATDEKVTVVIGGDSNYKNRAEEDQNVLSRWAFRIVRSELKEECCDGRKGFVFSWNEKHRAIHEKASLHFLDPEKTGVKFVCQSERLAKPEAAAVVEKSFSALDMGAGDVVDSMTQEDTEGMVDFMVLCCDQSAATVISDMYPLSGMRAPADIHIGSPVELKSHLLEGASVSLCAIGLQASDLKEILLSDEWGKSNFGDLLRTAKKAADRVVVVVMYSDRTEETLPLSQSEEVQVTEKVEMLIGEKGLVLWWRGKPRKAESSPQAGNPNKTLVLKTSIRNGLISFEEQDVIERREGYTPPDALVSDLGKKYSNVPKASLELYCEESSGCVHAVVKKPSLSLALKHMMSHQNWETKIG